MSAHTRIMISNPTKPMSRAAVTYATTCGWNSLSLVVTGAHRCLSSLMALWLTCACSAGLPEIPIWLLRQTASLRPRPGSSHVAADTSPPVAPDESAHQDPGRKTATVVRPPYGSLLLAAARLYTWQHSCARQPRVDSEGGPWQEGPLHEPLRGYFI